MSTPPPFLFVVGCPRSGTSLVTGMLSVRVAVPYETHFIPLFHRTLWLWGDLRRRPNRARLLRQIYEFLQIWTERASRGRDLRRLRQISLLATEPEARRVLDESSSFATLVDRLFASFARLRGLERWGDKSAFFAHEPLERLVRAVPDARFLHVVRDGRDVALSWMKEPYGPRDVSEAARVWRGHLEGKRRFGRRYSERYLELRYEDLLRSPREEMRRVASFAGIDYGEDLLDFRRNEFTSVFASGVAHPLMSQPLVESNRERWRREMAIGDRRLFESEAGASLAEFGYDLPRETVGVRTRVRALASRVGVPLRRHRVRLGLKAVLPIALGLAGRVGLPLARLLGRSELALGAPDRVA